MITSPTEYAAEIFNHIPPSVANMLAPIHPKLFGSRQMAIKQKYMPNPSTLIQDQITATDLVKQTDYDFSAQSSKEAKDLLRQAGFDIQGTGYSGNETVDVVYVKKCHRVQHMTTDPDHYLVNVILRPNNIQYMRMWDTIHPSFYMHYLWKSSPWLRTNAPGDMLTQHIDDLIVQMYLISKHG